MDKKSLPSIKKFPAAKQRRLDQLLDKYCEGNITEAEKKKLKQLVTEAEQLAVFNAKQLLKLSEGQTPPAGAVPVTVWVTPQTASR
ncbi:MAG TPA: hypothetical protein VGI40_13365 [Pirellulaceae bacterium]|jgi:hypothetical protein